MKKLLWLFLLFCLPVQAATYDLTWCLVTGVYGSWVSYEVCDNFVSGKCASSSVPVNDPAYSLQLPDNATANFAVRAVQHFWDGTKMQITRSQYSNPVQIVSGVTPPVVSCGCS